MQTKKKLVIVAAQLFVLATFGCLAAASGSQQAVVNSSYITREDRGVECSDPDYVYVGLFDTESEAESASKAMGCFSYCYDRVSKKCYGKK